jgi:hypothetical protein
MKDFRSFAFSIVVRSGMEPPLSSSSSLSSNESFAHALASDQHYSPSASVFSHALRGSSPHVPFYCVTSNQTRPSHSRDGYNDEQETLLHDRFLVPMPVNHPSEHSTASFNPLWRPALRPFISRCHSARLTYDRDHYHSFILHRRGR